MMDITTIVAAVISIGVITFVLSAIGVKVGSIFGSRFEKKAQFLGGAILVVLGIVMLVEGLLEKTC